MKKTVPLLLTLAVCLWAADAWQSKPFTDWSDKDVQRLLSSSPWAKEVNIALGGGGGGGSSKGGGKRGGGGGGGDMGGSGDAMSNVGNAGGSRSGTQEVGGLGGTPSLMLVIRWQSALPVRQAIAKQKYGSEAGTSPEAKKLLDDQKYYAVVVSGLPGRMLHASDDMKSNLLKATTLSVKGKDPVAAVDLQTAGNEQKAVVMFFFPKTSPVEADDKEVEFSSKFGPMIVKEKFKLKEMFFNGKLEL
jgi:hypothetical protein